MEKEVTKNKRQIKEKKEITKLKQRETKRIEEKV